MVIIPRSGKQFQKTNKRSNSYICRMKVFPAEYSSLSTNALLELVTTNYAVTGDASVLFLKRGFNDTYRIDAGESRFILRVYKHGWRNRENIETELKLLNYLNDNGVSVSFAVADKKNELIHTINAPEGERFVVLFTYAEGEQVKKLNAEQAFTLGASTGKMHALTENKTFGTTAQNYDIAVQFETTLTALQPVLKDHPEQYSYLKKLRDQFLETFNSIDKAQLSSGVCHGDLQAENFHIDENEKFTFFDLDFFGAGYLVYDIGVFI
jgi:Ser/Thr protein kinase RdoA (MazF antagonist)